MLRRENSLNSGTHSTLNYRDNLVVRGSGFLFRLSITSTAVRLCISLIACALCSFALRAYGQFSDQSPVAGQVLTNIQQIWAVPHDLADKEYRIKTEVTVYFDDTEWGNASGECDGRSTWLPLFDSPLPFKPGERVAIDGVIVPARERFVWSKTKTRILQEDAPLTAQTITNLNDHPEQLADHLVSVEGLIDSELDQSTHCTLAFLDGGVRAYAYILKGSNSAPVPFKPGDFVRITAVYSPQFDADGKLSSLSLWAGSPAEVKIVGSLDKDSRFDAPVTLSRDIPFLPHENLITVAGVVHKYDAGNWVTIWDKTGQVMIQSKQTQPVRFGDVVQAVGYPYYVGIQECLHNALYRVANPTNAAALLQNMATNALPLCLAEQVRDLSLEDAARHLPVSIQGIVTWAHPETAFTYVQDASGGVKVANPAWDDPVSMKAGTIVRLTGVTAAGRFVPFVTNAVLFRTGWINIDPGPLVTLDQALTGVEEANWVEMQGFVQSVNRVKGLIRFRLTTSSGEFDAFTPASQPYDWYKGAIIRLDGVCTARANKRHQLTGVQIWSPDINQFVHVEVPVPDNPFAAPFRSLANLRCFNAESALSRRIRTSGTIVQADPGHFICLEDGADGVLALSRQTNSLQPGDNVEVVGFPGEQGQKFVLREAIYRRTSAGPEPAPLLLSGTNSADSNLDGLLVTAHGTLLNLMTKNRETRLLIQANGFTFEASLDSSTTNDEFQNLQPASQISLQGVYDLQNDDYGRPQSFLLHLRSANDVQLLQRPPWWTTARLVAGLLVTIAVFLVALVWGLLITRKNALLGQAQTDLQTAKDKLEARVEERTRELQAQVKAREKAHAELAQAQRNLMLASRRAGMAEVATGVLHNVGNVLNSVNISTTLLLDQTRHSKTNSLVSAANLLKEKNGDLAAYLTSDPKGKLMPLFFVQVAEQLQREQANALEELQQLHKNVEHIKDIVAMQQSYAHVAGVVEKVTLESIVEDALRMNTEAMERHGVTVIRQFANLPELLVDKHKVLQILINLIRNAKYALDDCKEQEKRITITTTRTDGEQAMLRVQDNGVGIPTENLTRIFAHGFTTRANGHGFGLHIGALNARELGGSLVAASEGPGRGATFTLIVPFSPPSNPNLVHQT